MRAHKKGLTAITITFVVSFVLIAIALGLVFLLTTETREVGHRSLSKQAYYIAEGGAEKAIISIQSSIETTYASTHSISQILMWLDNLSGAQYINNQTLGKGKYSVTIESVTQIPVQNKRKVKIVSTGTVGQVSETIKVEVIYGFGVSRVFDNTYFINNYGWFWGGAEKFQGDVRANGQFSVRGAQRVNGDVYATEGVDTSQGSFFYDDLDRYYQTASTRARPGDPPCPGGGSYPGGYDAFADMYDSSGYARDPNNPQIHGAEEETPMPYLGDLSYYQQLAISQNGTIKQGSQTIVNNVYSGTLTLVGTSQNPIKIDGPVVVTNDVILKGVVQGQGTIYAGRNVHIIGNLTYKNPPSWPKPDYNASQTALANVNKDFLGLCSKGNVVMGDYTSSGWSQVKDFLDPSFTNPYVVDQTDSSIGYVSYWQGGEPYFDGDYLAYDGGKKSDNSNRRYYESSLSNSQFQNLNPTNSISQIDALVYTNHVIAGRVSNMNFNGSVIARDEAIVFAGYVTMNFDYRVKENGNEYVDIELPITVLPPQRLSWSR